MGLGEIRHPQRYGDFDCIWFFWLGWICGGNTDHIFIIWFYNLCIQSSRSSHTIEIDYPLGWLYNLFAVINICVAISSNYAFIYTVRGTVATAWQEGKVGVRGMPQVGEYGYATLHVLWIAFYFTNWVISRFCLANLFEPSSCGVCTKLVWFLLQEDEAGFISIV